jgi:hypothetical protein
MARVEERIAKMGADESGPAGDYDVHGRRVYRTAC